MNKRKTAQQVISEIADENIDLYVNEYNSMTESEIDISIRQLAYNLWDRREDHEIARDREACLIVEDYTNFIQLEFIRAGLIE